MEEFKQENTDIIALSVDPLEKAQEMVERTGATFPIGYGLKSLKTPTKSAPIGKSAARSFTRPVSRRAGSKNSPSLLCHRAHRPDRSGGCAEFDSGNQAEESPGRYLNLVDTQNPAPTTSPIIRKACSISFAINIQMSHHAHSARVHGSTEHLRSPSAL